MKKRKHIILGTTIILATIAVIVTLVVVFPIKKDVFFACCEDYYGYYMCRFS